MKSTYKNIYIKPFIVNAYFFKEKYFKNKKNKRN